MSEPFMARCPQCGFTFVARYIDEASNFVCPACDTILELRLFEFFKPPEDHSIDTPHPC